MTPKQLADKLRTLPKIYTSGRGEGHVAVPLGMVEELITALEGEPERARSGRRRKGEVVGAQAQ